LKKEGDKRDKERENSIKYEVNTEPPLYPYIDNIPYINYNEISIAFMWDKRNGIPNMIRIITTLSLSLTTSRRILRKRSTTC
jgi:hypothetical protein